MLQLQNEPKLVFETAAFSRVKKAGRTWQNLLAKTSTLSQCDYTTYTSLGFLGLCNTNRIISIYAVPPQSAKAGSQSITVPLTSCLTGLE
jgi:hypothetical protein